MQLTKVNYKKLNAKQKEIHNFQIVAGLLAAYGFNCIKLADDWQGADFLAYHKDGVDTLKVQLKSRLTIGQRYSKKSIYMAFPIRDSWYLIEHDRLVGMMRKHWTIPKLRVPNKSTGTPSKKIVASLAKCML